MTLTYNSSTELLVGGKNSLFLLDLNKPTTVQTFDLNSELSFINYTSKLLTLGHSSGALEVFDPVSNQSVKSFAGHNGLMSDLDVKGSYVATCGYLVRSKRVGSRNVEYMVDPLVNLFDLRMMRALSPVPFSAGASFVRFHPKISNMLIVASTSGQIQFVDMFDQLLVHWYQADLTDHDLNLGTLQPSGLYMANLEISENGEFLAFGDARRNVHLWSLDSNVSVNFVKFPAAIDHAEVTTAPISSGVSLDAPAPLNMVGMPYYREYLASNFPPDMIVTKELLKIPQPLDQLLLDAAAESPGQFIPYDRSRLGPRYVVAEHRPLRTTTNKEGVKIDARGSLIPKFISERSMTSSPIPRLGELDSPSMGHSATFSDQFADAETEELLQKQADQDLFLTKSPIPGHAPPCYSKLDIRYSKFGVQDFDFSYYNRTKGMFAGLENHIDNSYVNSIVQLYRSIPIFYNAVTNSLLYEYFPRMLTYEELEANPQGSSFLNELSYLLDMIHNAEGRTVCISNFSLFMNKHKLAQEYGLINKDDGLSLTGNRMQMKAITFNKFLVESVISDYANQFDVNVLDILATTYEVSYFTASGEFWDKGTASQATIDLELPPASVRPVSKPTFHIKKNVTILHCLEHTLNQSRITTHPTEYGAHLEVRPKLVRISPILLINIPFDDQDWPKLKSFKKWLVPEFYASTNASGAVSFRAVATHPPQRASKYVLLGYVCEVNRGCDSVSRKHNLVAYIRNGIKDQWLLFNDFLVMPISEDEVFDLSPSWKKPVIVIYLNVDDPHNKKFNYFRKETFARISSLNAGILFRDHFACGIREGFKRDYELLTAQEAPEFGSLIAIDAEFVSLKPEVIEISFTGARNVVRPKLLSLARVSVIRGGKGPGHGVPFIDDYIVHTEPIYDYLTTFSGIEEGDLDPRTSTKSLVTLQTAYRRLWLLLNMGCVFVGHGLQSDFRCINLQVPKAQIRDTIEYYYLPSFRRKLSLRFLAHIVLRESVQTANHDSIEDARTALLLYERYLELSSANRFEQELLRVYSEGQQLRFRVPEPF